MRNYVVLNGIKSNTVKGLLIQSLPPITKPLMRTQIEQIDGRDGDIVTRLGYSAYNKEMNIGLFGDYDVDDVIKYFSSEGTVTFSNEPGKYYNYQILEQIDFERLIRFKTATVTFHVQPYKYSAVDKTYIYTGGDDNFIVINRGNTVSKPQITIYGAGTVNLSVNGVQLFIVNIGEAEYIMIDATQMNAYKGDVLMNRYVIGDYDNLILQVGENTISWAGDVTRVDVSNYTRWI